MEKVIAGLDEVAQLEVSAVDGPADVRRTHPVTLPTEVHFKRPRGIHGAALSDGVGLLVVAEDVGRHNAVGKVKGEALFRTPPTEDRILLSTGRLWSEMLLERARMGVPIVASRTSPTAMVVRVRRAAHPRGVRPRPAGEADSLRRRRSPGRQGGGGCA